jgi:hypothetical protein
VPKEDLDTEEGPSLEALATLGRQAAATVHELNNVLTSVLGWAQVALRDLGNTATLEGALRTIEANSRRARRILRDAMDATRSDGQRRPTLPADVVDDSLRLLAWEIRRSGVRVQRMYQPVPEVNVDRTAIQQILVNLLLNAVQAMPKGGEIQVRVRPERGGVAIDVADTGPGMTEDVARRAFDPFFSTKSPAGPTGGSGLGLAIGRRLAEAHAGTLTASSAPEAGSVFTLWLPVGTATDEEEVASEPSVRTTRGRILVIDDEADIRDLLSTALALRGHAVETTGDAAVGITRATQPDVTLVLLDYNLPGAKGSEVLARLRAQRPELPVLFMSGRTGTESGEHIAIGPGSTGWLRKPFDLDEVYREVARLLARE